MQDSVILEHAIVDGINIKGLDKYRVQSPLFTFTLGTNNILGLPAQTTQALSDGNWVFLKPLPVGKHIVYFKGDLKTIDYCDHSSKWQSCLCRTLWLGFSRNISLNNKKILTFL
jgi:hypothetical protein